MNYQHYKKSYFHIPNFKRTWPEKEITHAPVWVSVDLRDGNQALLSPMTLAEKVEFFKCLVDVGFKEIEVGFPAASDTEYSFVRYLIDNDLIPDDVSIQVLTQSRPHIIKRTVEAIAGAKNVIVHLYNSTSFLQREVVFGNTRQETIQLALEGFQQLKELLKDNPNHIRYEYSPESFTCTEMDFAIEICNAVIDELKPGPNHKLIINLPSTIEVSTPNIYADQIEYVSERLNRQSSIILSVHAHNDRGTGVASSELALLAGAQRVEGTLFGNGERTGNADLVVIALNLMSVGIDPKLELSDIDRLIHIYKKFNKLPIHPRHPYVGEFAYTAFSGSHQDAIRKSMDYAQRTNAEFWENPYITIDPKDINRTYEPIMINSQSGKGGIGYVLETKFGYMLPKALLQDFTSAVKSLSDRKHAVLEPDEIYEAFRREYINRSDNIELLEYHIHAIGSESEITAKMKIYGETKELKAVGNGPLDALCLAIRPEINHKFEIATYSEHALDGKSSSRAVTYIALSDNDGTVTWGAGVHPNINTSSLYALVSALNRM